MTWRLDPPIRVGSRIFAALTRMEVSAHAAGPMVLASARKQPHTILMFDGDHVTALDLDGQVLTTEDTARNFPEAVAQLRAWMVEARDANLAAPPSADPNQRTT